MDSSGHIPVLAGAVEELLAVNPGDVVLDATVGAGGHARILGERTGSAGHLIGLDVDDRSLAVARETLTGLPCKVSLVRSNFSRLPEVLGELGIQQVDVLLADLGFASMQVDDHDRGLSFQHDGPLDMRLDSRQLVTAESLIQSLPEKELADVIFRFGEERKSRSIARLIVQERSVTPIRSTLQLANLVCRALRANPQSHWQRIHPATKTFQALRIAVNDELGSLELLLGQSPSVVAEGGRFGVISFHSLEDRMIKHTFRSQASAGLWEIVTKKPVVAGEEEIRHNPRSRSAKLRVVKRATEVSLAFGM